MEGKIKDFTDLEAWREGHKLVLIVYRLTKDFPKDEQFGLISQTRRCVVSVTSNIAEGFSRQSYREKVQFYSVALGSLTELQNQMLIARDVAYLTGDAYLQCADQMVRVHKLTNGLIRKSRQIHDKRMTSLDS